MTERPRVCRCVADEQETCTCDVPFIGNFAEADRRVADGTLKSLEMADVKAAVRADILAGAPRLRPPEPPRAVITIATTSESGG